MSRSLFPDVVGLRSSPTHLSTLRCAKAALNKQFPKEFPFYLGIGNSLRCCAPMFIQIWSFLVPENPDGDGSNTKHDASWCTHSDQQLVVHAKVALNMVQKSSANTPLILSLLKSFSISYCTVETFTVCLCLLPALTISIQLLFSSKETQATQQVFGKPHLQCPIWKGKRFRWLL